MLSGETAVSPGYWARALEATVDPSRPATLISGVSPLPARQSSALLVENTPQRIPIRPVMSESA
jgi:hypothetical protein